MQYLQTLRTISFAFIMSQIMFLGVVIFLHSSGQKPENGSGLPDSTWLIMSFLAIVLILAGRFLFQQKIKVAQEKSSLQEKLAEHRTAWLLRIALTEAASLFSIVLSMLSGDLRLLGIAVVVIAYMLTFIPSKNSIINDLALTYPMTDELEQA